MQWRVRALRPRQDYHRHRLVEYQPADRGMGLGRVGRGGLCLFDPHWFRALWIAGFACNCWRVRIAADDRTVVRFVYRCLGVLSFR